MARVLGGGSDEPGADDVDERTTLLRSPRVRRDLPVLSAAAYGRRHLPLLEEARAVDRRFRPTIAVWELTLRCDLACRHCGSRAGHGRPDELSREECLDLVRQMAELGVMEVTLIGGEAYLREDWLDIARAIREHGIELSMTTGGRGFTRERARLAKEAGLQSLSVSLDGDEETHDRLRGVRGSYRSALDALVHAREAGLQVAVNSQINRLSMPVLGHVLDRVIESGGHSWQIMLTVAMGRAADESEILLQPYELLELFPRLAELTERARAAGVRLWPGNNLGYFGPYESILRGSTPRGHSSSCGAGRNVLGIESDGSIKGCPSLPSAEFTGGNVRDATLREIWERSAPLRYTRDRTVDDLWGYCRECYYARECMAGCTWTNSTLFDRPGNNPYCHHRALERQRAGLRERLVRRDPGPGHPFDHGQFDLILEPIPAMGETSHSR